MSEPTAVFEEGEYEPRDLSGQTVVFKAADFVIPDENDANTTHVVLGAQYEPEP